MTAKGLKIVGTWGHVYHGVAWYLPFFSKQFEDVWASRLWVLVLKFGPILAWYTFPAAEEFVVIFDVFFI